MLYDYLKRSQFNEYKDFRCLQCTSGSEIGQWTHFLDNKFRIILQEQTELERETSSPSLRCQSHVEEYHDAIGPCGQKLLDSLNDLKVERQAYHGDVFVGNHCYILLQNCSILCSVSNDMPDLHEKCESVFFYIIHICPPQGQSNYNGRWANELKYN